MLVVITEVVQPQVPGLVVAQEAALLTSMVQAVLQVVDKVLVLALVQVQEEVHQLQ